VKHLLRVLIATLLLLGTLSTTSLADGTTPAPTCGPGVRKC